MARKLFITGGAGFIGVNTAARALGNGDEVVVYDNLSRRGGDANLDWLREQGEITFVEGDIRDFDRLREAFADHADADAVIHLAGQVAVTTSIADPRDDYESNA